MIFLNHEYPTKALGAQAPFHLFPQARHSSRAYRPEAEEHDLDLRRVHDYLQNGRWFRQTSPVGAFSLGGYLYNATKRFAGQTLEITLDATTAKLICLPEKNTAAFYLDTQGLTKTALMGNRSFLPGYSAYQLTLPLC